LSFAKTLLRGTKKVHESIENSSPRAPRESRWLTAGFRESCSVLGDLLIDPEFMRFVRSRRQTLTLEEGRVALADYARNRKALHLFLSAEGDLFAQAGLPTSIAEHLLRRCFEVTLQPPPVDRAEIADVFGDLRMYLCEKATLLEASRRRGVLSGVRDVFGGLLVAALNGGLLAATVGMSGAQCAVSVVIGGMIAADGYSSVRRLF
jgi:hypothetical protein